MLSEEMRRSENMQLLLVTFVDNSSSKLHHTWTRRLNTGRREGDNASSKKVDSIMSWLFL